MLKRLVAILAAALRAGAAAAVFLVGRGHERQPARTVSAHRHHPATHKRPSGFSWPDYGYDLGRTHAAPPLGLRPPFRKLWTVPGDWSLIEFPPVLDDGRLFLGTNHGLVLSVQAATGRVLWKRQFAGCVAASPAVGNGVVYLGFMDPPPCRGTAPSFLAALDARTGRTLWRFRAGVVETPPLLAGGRVYFGSWDHRVYAVDARTGRRDWSFSTGDRVKGGVAFAGGTIFVGSYDGRVYALDAATGRLRWTLRTSSFVYSPVALSGAKAFVGSYDHRFYALSQATGRIRWTFDAGAPISGAPTVLDGLVYFSTCGSCSTYEQNPRARRTYALDARTGKIAWRFPDGEYSPVIADRERLYLTGYTHLYGLVPR